MRQLTGVLVAVLLLTGCGSGDEESAAQAEASASAAEESEAAAAEERAAEAEERRQEEAAAAAEARAAYQECTELLGPLRESLEEIDSRLSIGLNIGDYSTRLGDAVVAYDQVAPEIDVDTEPRCLTSASLLEDAYNEYAKGQGRWQECIDDINCDFGDSELGDQTQTSWRKAGQALDRSARILDNMQP